jgi:two-component system, sensor histidine kinase PdtaS
VSPLPGLACCGVELNAAHEAWLRLLISDWQLVADLSFADLVLWVPTATGQSFVAVAQMRPTTSATVYRDDIVGTVIPQESRTQLLQAMNTGRICRVHNAEWFGAIAVREETIPVRCQGEVIAVVSRMTNLAATRTPSRLELTYLQTAGDLATMISEGRFPIPTLHGELDATPRVGDGLLRLDRAGKVSYASPNALSAYRRLGLAADLEGSVLGTVTAGLVLPERLVEESLEALVSGRRPRQLEVEGGGAVVLLRVLPLEPGGHREGAVVLLRDVTEVRHRDRELVTKDATIREIHHRVKNNLQTVAALLRLQARRIEVPEGRMALDEAMNRVASIALVHETLSFTLDENVSFDEIADRMLAMVPKIAAGETLPMYSRSGSFGIVSAEVATPLAMILNELLHNAVEHGLNGKAGRLELTARQVDGRLHASIADDGVGLPGGFDIRTSSNLGLQIVRTLVEGELGGTLRLRPRRPTGTVSTIDVPVRHHQVNE